MKTGIALFVYNRPDHTRKVLEGLKKNYIKKLYIFSDGSKKEEHIPAVDEVQQIIAAIDWCETEVIQSKTNKGLANSIVDGVNYVLSRHERIIVLEDDCVPSEDFVEFMEQCFNTYSNDDTVMNVTGYSLPIEIPYDYSYDTYFCYRASSWGWGTWRRAWNKFTRDPAIIYNILGSKELLEKVNYSGRDLLPMLEAQIKGQIQSWAIYWALIIIQHDGLCVQPVKSRIMNIGFDKSGVHCGDTNQFNVELSLISNKRIKLAPVNQVDRRIINNYGDFCSKLVMSENERKFQSYYRLVNKWLTNIHNKKNVSIYFENKKIKNISIYGCGEMGLRLFEEINNSNINVVNFVDQNRGGFINSVKIIGVDQLADVKVDCIVITPIFDYFKIKKEINDINSNLNILSLESIIDYLFKN